MLRACCGQLVQSPPPPLMLLLRAASVLAAETRADAAAMPLAVGGAAGAAAASSPACTQPLAHPSPPLPPWPMWPSEWVREVKCAGTRPALHGPRSLCTAVFSSGTASPSAQLLTTSLAAAAASLAGPPSRVRAHCFVPVRTAKTFTSNVMDENRSRRVREHFAYHKAHKAWRAEVASRLERWRHELRAADAAAAAVAATAGDSAAEMAAARRQQMQQHQYLDKLEAELRRAQLDFDIARLRLSRAQRAEQQAERAAQLKAAQREALLEASRRWVGSTEELTERINAALDAPRPFGFITNLPRTTL
uniref:Uncharacterized protein n=1 Tax=Chlamydomonas euryale TaxID=1486919 RepID=A0A7R9W1F4_9CHLO|mmetsp:Transcript_9048/g.27573  ORF Transcript_9048/g.27573 Transcript_9048/m.27573 type:complete len:306 (+) Transcript_9048:342-1259(+)